MKAKLKIAYSEKEAAKKIAREHKCALWFENGDWHLSGTNIPDALAHYVIDGSITTDDTTTKDIENQVKIIKQNIPPPYTYVMDLPFMLRELATDIGGYFNKEHKVYLVKKSDKIKQVQQFLSQPYSYESWIERILNNDIEREELIKKYAKETTIVPRDYQNIAFKHILNAYEKELGGFLLADEVGLGKTISAALMAQHKDIETILIVTTLAAVPHWRKTLLQFALPDKKIIIINYDRLQKLFIHDETKYKAKAKTKRTKNKRLAKDGEAPEFDLVVFDESHKLKNNTTMRSKLALKISENAGFVLYLSATAGQNPLELSYLAPLLAKITGDSVANMNDFEKWCVKMKLGVSRGDFGKWLWDSSQESIDKVHDMLFKGKPLAALRRSPKDIKNYPEISRALTPLELSPDELCSYNLAWNEFKKDMLQENTNKKIKKGDSKNALVAQLRLRQKASFLKIPYTLDQIEDLLENEHQVAVSVAFRETLTELEEKLNKSGIGVSVIHGGQNSTEKESQRMDFQIGKNKVVIFTVEEAISLHQGEYNDAPRSMIIHDLRWSAISMSQIEGRTHRDGKFSQIYWLFFNDSIEEDIAKIVLNRVISMKGMIGDDTSTLKEIESMLNQKLLS